MVKAGMPKPESLAHRLRRVAILLRHTSVPMKDVIPLLLEAAERIDELTTPNNDDEENEDSRC